MGASYFQSITYERCFSVETYLVKTLLKHRIVNELCRNKDTIFISYCKEMAHALLFQMMSYNEIRFWMIYQRRFCREIQVGRFFFCLEPVIL